MARRTIAQCDQEITALKTRIAFLENELKLASAKLKAPAAIQVSVAPTTILEKIRRFFHL